MFRHAASLRVIPASIVTNTAQIARRVANLINPLSASVARIYKPVNWFAQQIN